MRTSLFILATSLVLGIRAQEIESDDVPTQCQQVCASTITSTFDCGNQYDDDDPRYLDCVCNAQNARRAIPNCEACVAQYDETDNDVRELVYSCGFNVQTTISTPRPTNGPSTVTSSATTGNAAGTVTVTTSAPTSTDTDNDHDEDHDNDPDDDDNNDPDDDNNDPDDDDNDGNAASGNKIPATACSLLALLIAVAML